VSANWVSLGGTLYDKAELYTGVFSNLSGNCQVVSGLYSGPVLTLERGLVTVYSGAGQLLHQWKWNNPPATTIGFTDEEEPLFVLEDGTVLTYSLQGVFRTSFSMGQEAKTVKILSARIFPSHAGAGVGVCVLTRTHRFYLTSSVTEPRVRPLYNCGEVDAGAWEPLLMERSGGVVVARGRDIARLTTQDMTVLEMVQGQGFSTSGRVINLILSPSCSRLCSLLDTGLLWLGELGTNTASKLSTTQLSSLPSNLAWCGETAVLLTGLEAGGSLLVHTSGDSEPLFQPPTLHLVQEWDGVRIISQGCHELLSEVAPAVQSIFRIASIAPGALLLMASQAFQSKSHTADEYLRMVEGKGDMAMAVSQCTQAAGGLFQAPQQKALMRAARLGQAMQQQIGLGTSDMGEHSFYQQCITLKLLNAVRHYKIGIPLTLTQLERLGQATLIDRLINRRLFPLALKICDFLQLPSIEGSSRVLAHWAIYKVETSTEDDSACARAVSSRLGLRADISYSDIAEKAAECGKKQLAIQLLEHEVRAERQVPLLLKLGCGGPALRKALASGDTDLVYHVILSLQEQHSKADFHLMMRSDPGGSKLYSLYCHNYAPGAQLQDWLQQEDDLVGLGLQAFKDSYSQGRLEGRLGRLVTAQEHLRRGRQEFLCTQAEEAHRLLKYQGTLEDKLGKVFTGLSLHSTISLLLMEKEAKLAEKLKTEFKVPERRWYWLRLRAYGQSGEWGELLALAKSKKSSPIGSFTPFLDICLQQGERGQAAKYLSLLTQPEEKLRYFMKLDMLSEAAECAFSLRNLAALSAIELKAGNNFSLLESIAGLKQRLSSGAGQGQR